MGILDDILAEYGQTASKIKARTPEGQAYLDKQLAKAEQVDLPQDATDQDYNNLLFHHVGKPDLNKYDMDAPRMANANAPVGMWTFSDRKRSDQYLRDHATWSDADVAQTGVVTRGKNAYVIGADKPTEGMRNSYIQAMENRFNKKYDELLPHEKGYFDEKIDRFMRTGSPEYGLISGQDQTKLYTDNGIDILVNGDEIVHLRPEQLRKPDAKFDEMMLGENDLNAFTGGKRSGGILDQLGNTAASAGSAYMQSDDTDYGEDATSAYADVPAKIWENMSLLDKAALITSPIPFVGGVTGVAADVANMYNNPDERTALNAGLLAANFIPAKRIADTIGIVSDAVVHNVPKAQKAQAKTKLEEINVKLDSFKAREKQIDDLTRREKPIPDGLKLTDVEKAEMQKLKEEKFNIIVKGKL